MLSLFVDRVAGSDDATMFLLMNGLARLLPCTPDKLQPQVRRLVKRLAHANGAVHTHHVPSGERGLDTGFATQEPTAMEIGGDSVTLPRA